MPSDSQPASAHASTASGDLTRRRWCRAAAALGACAWLPAARAGGAPTGPVVLTIKGRVHLPNDGDAARFDMAMLERLPQTSFTTRTPWYSGARRFTGPLVRDVLAKAGARGARLRAGALNDYHADIPMDDVVRHEVIIARLLDGAPMSVRDKGPLFIVYPFDAEPELRSSVYYSRSVWQLSWIEVQ